MTNAREEKRGHRVTVRLDQVHATLLQDFSREMKIDASGVIRMALDQLRVPAQRIASPDLRVAASPKKVDVLETRPTGDSRQTVPCASQAPAAAAVRPQPSPIGVGAHGASFAVRTAELLSQYRSFGAQIWPERTQLFWRLLAAATIAQANNENPKDAELHRELLQIGQKYGLLN